MKITAADAFEEIDRELAFRSRVYPMWVKDGRMTQTKADVQTARMERARAIVQFARDAGALVSAEFTAGRDEPAAVVVEYGGVEYRYERVTDGKASNAR